MKSNQVVFLIRESDKCLAEFFNAIVVASGTWASNAPASRLIKRIEKLGSSLALANMANNQLSVPNGGWKIYTDDSCGVALCVTRVGQYPNYLLEVWFEGSKLSDYGQILFTEIAAQMGESLLNKDDFGQEPVMV